MIPKSDSCWESKEHCKTLKTKIMIITDDFIKELLPFGNENNRNREDYFKA